MAKGTYKIIDSDLHIVEPADLWQKYIEKPFLDRAPRGLSESDWDIRVEVMGQVFPRLWPTDPAIRTKEQAMLRRKYGEAIDAGFSAKAQMRAMAREGLDLAVFFPSRALWAIAVNDLDPKLSAAICRAYNNWLNDFIHACDPKRCFGAGMIPVHDPKEAATEARRVVKALGFKCVFVRPNIYNGRAWHDPVYDPLWQTCQELDVPVCFHEAIGTALPEAGIDRYRTFAMLHTVAHPFEQMMAAVSMVMGGVLAKYPKLRVAFLEANSSWVPFLLERMDSRFEWRGPLGEVPQIKKEPSYYFKRQAWTSVEADEALAANTVKIIGDDRLLISTDFPHSDAHYPKAMQEFLELPLTAASKRKILWDNQIAFYKIGKK
jgi:predicted TIM-barrel fold metal-dependent hydrolase